LNRIFYYHLLTEKKNADLISALNRTPRWHYIV